MKDTKLVMIFLALLVAYFVFFDKDSKGESPEQFFNRYIQLGNDFDPSIVDLYSDNAKIRAYKNYPNGKIRALEWSGKEWKELIIQSMTLIKERNNQDTFSNIIVSKYANGYKIKANGYSAKKCYTDTNYYMFIENFNGKFQITQERLETIALSNC